MKEIKAYKALPFLNDPERIAEDERLQEIRKASFGRGHLTEEERNVARGMDLIEIASTNLDLAEEKRRQGKTRRSQGGATMDMITTEKAKLAEGLALTGRFREAAEAHPQITQSKEYEKIADAIDLDDEDECECKPKVVELKGVQIEVPPTWVSQRVYSLKHGRMVDVEVCKCGHMNAHPITKVPKPQATRIR